MTGASPVARLAVGLVLSGAAYAGITGIGSDLIVAHDHAPRDVFSPGFRREMAGIERALPDRVPVLEVASSSWYPLVIQRYFYPDRAVAFLGNPKYLTLPEFRDFVQRHGLRYAITQGDPPPDPGFVSHRTFPAFPGEAGEVWVGELRR